MLLSSSFINPNFLQMAQRIIVPSFEPKNGLFTTKERSLLMSKIKGSNTSPEIQLRKALWNAGLRYRLKSKIFGKPDIIFPRQKILIFIDGDFWHGNNWAIKKAKLKSNKEYWIAKIERNMQRDKEVNRTLKTMGWKVIRFWESEVKRDPLKCIEKVISEII